MFPQFFGVPQSAMRRGILKGLSGSAIKLYIALCHESERCRSRELKRTVSQLRKLVGGAPNSHVKARRELARAGLVQFVNRGAEGFVFRLCDPVTSQPWPGDPKERVPYQKLTAQQPRSSIVTQSDPPPSQVQNASLADIPWRASVPPAIGVQNMRTQPSKNAYGSAQKLSASLQEVTRGTSISAHDMRITTDNKKVARSAFIPTYIPTREDSYK